VAECAQHDDVDPALEIVGDIVERLAGIETAAVWSTKKALPPRLSYRLRK